MLFQITPDHDFHDFVEGQHHKLDSINIMALDGKLNNGGGIQFAGIARYRALVTVIEALKERVRSLVFVVLAAAFLHEKGGAFRLLTSSFLNSCSFLLLQKAA